MWRPQRTKRGLKFTAEIDKETLDELMRTFMPQLIEGINKQAQHGAKT